MVLAGNEWQSNKDDEQKTNASSAATTAAAAGTTAATTTPATATSAVAVAVAPAAAVVSNVITSVTCSALATPATTTETITTPATTNDLELAARPAALATGGTGSELTKRQQQQHHQRHNKKAHNKMELNKKAAEQQQQLEQHQQREKHETETCELLATENSIISSSLSNSISNDANDNLENQENNNTTTTESCDSNTNTLQGQLAQQQVQFHMAINSVLNANNTTVSGNLFSSLGALQMPNNETAAAAVAAVVNNCNSSSPAAQQADLSASTGEAKIVLQCEGKSHKFETRNILLAPGQECKVGRLIAKSKASESNAIFDCKVLSRNHAMLWYTPDGHFWVKDTKSSNGTFINDNKLGNEPAELHYGDTVKFGVEVIENSRQEVHGCIIARVTLFMPDGREAISIESEQLQLGGPNRISYDEIQRLNAFLQEASQREKMLKAKLSNLQGVLDSMRKNSTMCWQSMITEDQLLHKINLLEKKLQMMEKNVPENALRNEIVKLLEDKTTYQLTAKEALRKVYQDRCDAMQMLSKMEMAYTTSDNECGILRTQILNSKQTLQDFNVRLEQLQQEYTEYKQETMRQQLEAKEDEEQRMGHLKDQLNAQEIEMDKMRQQLMRLQKIIADYDSEQAMQQQQALEQLNAAIGGDDDDDDDEDDDEDDEDDDDDDDDDDDVDVAANAAADEDKDQEEIVDQLLQETTPSKQKSSKKNKRQQKDEFDLKHKVMRKDTMMKWLKNSDLNKGADGGDVLKAIFNNDDDSGEDETQKVGHSLQRSPAPLSAPVGNQPEAAAASDEFIHKSPQHNKCLNGIEEAAKEESVAETEDGAKASLSHAIHLKLETQPTLVCHDGDASLSQEQTLDMLNEECMFYKKRSATLTTDINALEVDMQKLKEQLQQQQRSPKNVEDNDKDNKAENDLATDEQQRQQQKSEDKWSHWQEELINLSDEQVEREEQLITYKDRLQQSELSNIELRRQIQQLRHTKLIAFDNPMIYRRALPVGCVALVAILYFLASRF